MLLSNRRYKFYKAIRFDKEHSDPDSKTETAGNVTLLGQIATFLEGLHLTYHEVVYEIPYRNLLIMQQDKLHVAYNGVVKEGDGKAMMERRMRNRQE